MTAKELKELIDELSFEVIIHYDDSDTLVAAHCKCVEQTAQTLVSALTELGLCKPIKGDI